MWQRLLSVVACVALLSLAGASGLPAGEPSAAGAPDKGVEKPAKPALTITISRETTRIVRPLREDGYVDYVAALNEHVGRGVTPENNAAVPFCRAMGPADISEESRDRYFKLLGIPPLPAEGDYFVSFGKILKRRGLEWNDDVDKEFDRAGERPWSEKECPLVAEWLKINEKPMRLMVEASRRPRFYSPLVAQEGAELPLIAVLLPAVQQSRSAARVLLRRAMLRAAEGKLNEAREDLLACHRFGRLVGQGSTLIDALVAIAIDGIACKGDTVLAHTGKLNAEQAARFRAELRKLAPMPKMVEKLDVGERFMYLDAVASIARQGPEGLPVLEALTGSPEQMFAASVAIVSLQGPHTSRDSGASIGRSIRSTLMRWAMNMAVDWDQVLRMGNSFYDEVVEGCRKPTFAQRKAALEAMNEKLKRLAKDVKDPKSISRDLLSGKTPRAMVTQRMGGIFIALLMPAMLAATTAEDRGLTNIELTEVVLALAGYHADRGAYPKELKDLVPKYVDELPKDLFTGGPFRYMQKDQGYLLYSVGPNTEDDGGRNAWYDPEAEDDPDYEGDDIAIRTPAPKR